MTLRSVLDGGRYFEGPRWHAGRLPFVDCMERTLLSLFPSGEREQHAKFEDDTPKAVVTETGAPRIPVIASVAKQSIHRRVRRDGLLRRFRSSQ
jgi:hypothetical protein